MAAKGELPTQTMYEHLLQAISEGALDKVKALASHSQFTKVLAAPPGSKSSLHAKPSAFTAAAQSGSLQILEFLIQSAETSSPAIRWRSKRSDYKLLLGACSSGSKDMVQFVTDHLKVPVNPTPKTVGHAKFYATPVEQAVLARAADVVEHLLALGARPDIPSKRRGETPLELAAAQGNAAMVTWLHEQGARVVRSKKPRSTAVHLATKAGNLECIDATLRAGGDINERDALGRTPLHIAVSMGRTDLLLPLLQRGCDPRIANNRGVHPVARIKPRDRPFKDLLLHWEKHRSWELYRRGMLNLRASVRPR